MRDTAGEVRTNLLATFSLGPLHTYLQVVEDQQELINHRSVQTQDVVKRTCRKRWMIE